MTYRSTIILSKEGKWYVARSVELRVVSQGRTIEEAQKNLREAIDLYLEDKPKEKRMLVWKGQAPLVTSLEI